MARKPSEAGSYTSTNGGGSAPAPAKRRRPARASAAAASSGGQPQVCASNGAETPNEFSVPEQEEIARLAYSYWEARGGEGGSSDDDWFRAEQEVRRKREVPAR